MTDTAVEECPMVGTECAVPVIPERPSAPPSSAVAIARTARLRHDLRYSIGDAAGSGVMVGTGETYLPAFALAAGLGAVVAGLVASVPQLAGGVTQLISPRAVRLLGSHRRWVVACATIQALSFVPLVIAAWRGSASIALVLGAATLYWSAGLASGPPWNTWMGTIVPDRVRARYFAFRTRMQQGAVLAGFLLSGAAIQFGATSDNALTGFALLFGLALVCRLTSARFLAGTSEPHPMPPNVKYIPLSVLLRRFCRGAEAQRLLYLSLVQGAAYFAGPYFAPYMLRVLKLSYPEYMILISTAYVAKVASLNVWGTVAARFGVRKLLWIGGIGIVPVAGVWLISNNFWFLILVQLLAGAAWAAYELAIFLIYFNSIRTSERTSVLAVFNLSTTAAMVVGSLLGASVLMIFGASQPIYFVLFAGSSVLRAGTVFFLRRIPDRLIEGQMDGRRRRTPRYLSVRPILSNLSQATNAPAEWIEPSSQPLRRTA